MIFSTFQEAPARFLSRPLVGIEYILGSMGVVCILEAAQSFRIGIQKNDTIATVYIYSGMPYTM